VSSAGSSAAPGDKSKHKKKEQDVVMKNGWILSTCSLALILGACSSAPPKPEGVLIVEDENRVRGCRPLGTVSDDALDDLQKKAARLGGNVALMTPQRKAKGGYFGLQDYMTADVYRCETTGAGSMPTR
jgi:hypothetical protein